ncbi:MAG: hypothetical protein EXQ84_07245 [Rhodospirillaceae bacterium]|nr:hypothetical protein [Rhodospirillaceae bacterium]
MTHFYTRRRALGIAAAGVFASAGTARADEVLDARHTLDEAVITVDRVREETRSGGELDSALKRAKGVLIIPSYYKASFILGGSYGDGVLMARLPEGGFSDPAFYRMTAGSLGLQFGMQSAAIIFAILTEKGLSAVLNDEFKLGAAVGMSIGTVGAGAEAATTTHVGQDIVAYSTNTGLFAGASFEGAVIRPRKDWNAGIYGVGNDNPVAITQRNLLRIAVNLKDSLGKSAVPAQPQAN